MNPQTPRRLTSEDRYWAQRALALSESSLTDLRATADKWRSGLTSLTGVLTAALALAAPFVSGAVDGGVARFFVLLFVGIAVCALGIGTWKAMTAAFGIPATIDNDGEELRIWSEKAARSASDQLACARLMTVIGFAALVIAAGVGYANSGTASSSYRVTVDSTGDEYCGSMAFRDDGKTLVVTGADGTIHTTDLADATSIESVEKC